MRDFMKAGLTIALAWSATNTANAADVTQVTGQALATSIFQQIVRCWNPSVPTTGNQPIVVRLKMSLNADGQLTETPTLLDNLDTSVPAVNEAVQAATKAIQVCAPYKLPFAQYPMWKLVVITFDPRLMQP